MDRSGDRGEVSQHTVRAGSARRHHPVQADEPPATRHHHQGQRLRWGLQIHGQH